MTHNHAKNKDKIAKIIILMMIMIMKGKINKAKKSMKGKCTLNPEADPDQTIIISGLIIIVVVVVGVKTLET